MEALAEVVLPSDLGSQERTKTVGQFWLWLDGFSEGVRRKRPRELPSEVHLEKYSPASPKDRYLSQLSDLLSRSDGKFASVSREERERIVLESLEQTVPTEMEYLPWPAALAGQPGDHIALALSAFFLYSNKGRRMALGAPVDVFTCHSLEDVGENPGEA